MGENVRRRGAIGFPINGVAGLLETPADGFAHVMSIFDQKDAHAR
jgi:hypothetical protein